MAELVYAVVLGAMSFGLLVRVQSLVFLFGNITQLVRVFALQAESHRFDSGCFQFSFTFIKIMARSPQVQKDKLRRKQFSNTEKV